jgi:hypothetical protein
MSKQFSAFEKHREAVRELEMRRQVYKRHVDSAKLSRDVAARRIAIMAEIADDYAEQAKGERLL